MAFTLDRDEFSFCEKETISAFMLVQVEVHLGWRLAEVLAVLYDGVFPGSRGP